MIRLDRLINTRRHQRDAAAEELSRAQQRLLELAEARGLADTELRSELQRSLDQGATLTSLDLERLDAQRGATEHAARCGEQAVARARELALEYHQLLRQVEVLRDKVAERERLDENQKERRQLDDLAGRRRGRQGALLLPLLLCLSEAGCRREAAPPSPDAGAVDVGVATTPASRPASRPASQPARPPASQPASQPAPSDAGAHGEAGSASHRDSMVFTVEELRGVAKLRDRANQVARKEQELARREQQLAASARRTSAPVTPPVADPKAQKTVAPPPPPAELVNLVRVLREMNRRAAAAMLAEMDAGTAAAALRRLSTSQVAGILTSMPPDRAAPVAARLAKADEDKDKDKPVRTDAGVARPVAANPKHAASGAAGNTEKSHVADAGK